jgi:tetratricopeptide (TPR) repeat protein
MKALFLSAAAVALAALPSAAQPSILTIGSSLAESCYRAAEASQTALEARETCDRALSEEALTHDDRVGTYVNRGVLWLVYGDLDRAESDFDRALALDPREPEAWLNKGIAQLRRGNSREALPLIAKAIDLQTRKPAVAFYMRGIANEDSGNIRAAYADLQRARQLDPSWNLPAKELARYQVRSR